MWTPLTQNREGGNTNNTNTSAVHTTTRRGLLGYSREKSLDCQLAACHTAQRSVRSPPYTKQVFWHYTTVALYEASSTCPVWVSPLVQRWLGLCDIPSSSTQQTTALHGTIIVSSTLRWTGGIPYTPCLPVTCAFVRSPIWPCGFRPRASHCTCFSIQQQLVDRGLVHSHTLVLMA